MRNSKTISLFGKDYVINLWISRLLILILLSLSVYMLYLNDFSFKARAYSYCPNDSSIGCVNIFYNSSICNNAGYSSNLSLCDKGYIFKDCPICSTNIMYPGEFLGREPDFFTSNFWLFIIGIILVVIIINTLLFNKGFFKKNVDSNNKIVGGNL